MTWLPIGMALLLSAASALAQCRPSGRDSFAAGLEALSRGDLPAAAARFEEVVHAQPDCAEARNNFAVVLVEQGRIDEAAYQLRQALRARPDYYRARLNLDRVVALITAQRREAFGEAPLGSAEARPLAAEPAVPAAPPNIAALEPPGASLCVIEPTSGRVCLYHRAARAIVADGCHATVGVEMRTRPRWLVASDVGGQRIRLVDELAHERLKIVPDTVAVAGDTVQLAPRAFDALASKVVAWRTMCIVAEPAAAQGVPAVSHANGTLAVTVRDAIERWRQTQEEKQVEAYFDLYSWSFVPQSEPEIGGWRERKRYVFEHAATISLEVGPPSIFVFDDGATVITSFEQWYRSGTKVAHTFKVLRWQWEADRWVITAETALNEYP